MPIVSLENLSLAYGEHRLLDRVSLTVHPGERVCLVGRNGEGKSTLLRVISGTTEPDDGERWVRPGHRISSLAQDLAVTADTSVYANVIAGVPEQRERLQAYHTAVGRVAADGGRAALADLDAAQHALEAAAGWELSQRVDELISRLGLDPDASLGSLSGGWRRRAMLARALIVQPDLLLLDEPTNHLDIDAITWLEAFMLDFDGALVFVSHDRAFAKRLATRVIELDRGRLTSWPGSVENFLRRKREALAAEARAAAEFDRKLAQEEAWIRKGIKARRTRNEGRVRALEAMRRAQRERRERLGQARLSVDSADLSGKIVVDAVDASAGYDGRAVVRGVTIRVLRGDRIGVVGPNGSGKSTLLKLLLGELPALSGRLTPGTRLATGYFDQQRERLDPEKSVFDNVNEGSEFIDVRGRKRHVAGYLKDFLFPPAKFHSPVAILSGGERNRLLLAKLLAKPANLLVLDEPTNDLDVETLELLEDMLLAFDGTLIVVSHDREFLDNVVSGIVHVDGDGRAHEYVGNFSDFRRQHRPPPKPQAPRRQGGAAAPVRPAAAQPRKLSYNEQREFDALPAAIDAQERRIAALTGETTAAGFYERHHSEIAAALNALDEAMRQLDELYERWGALDERAR